MEDDVRQLAIVQADEALLAELGYKQEFKREFRPLEVFGMAFSIIGLVPSIASVLFYSIPNGGGPAMVWGWLVASVFIMIVGMSMAELGSAQPTSGGLYFWTYSLASKRWRNLLCWIVGYANTIASIASVASIDWGAAVQVMAAATIGSNGAFRETKAQLFGVYAAIVISHAVVCCFGTRVLARLQTIYIVLNILYEPLLLLVLYLLIDLIDFIKILRLDGWPNGFAFMLSFLAPSWTIGSFDSSVHISEEASNAAKAVPWAIVGAIGIGGILGCAINITLAFCMGTDLEALNDSHQPMADIFLRSFGQRGALGLWVWVVIIQYFMGSSMLLAASRQTFAFSRDGALPLSKWLYRMNPTTRSPVNVVWFDAIGALILGLLAFAGDQAINAIFSMSITASYIAYVIPVVVRYTGGRELKPGPFNLGVFSLPVAIISVLFMAFMGLISLFPSTTQSGAIHMNYSIVVVGGVMGFSLLWYYFPKYGGVHWFTGPVRNISPPASDDNESFLLPSVEKVVEMREVAAKVADKVFSFAIVVVVFFLTLVCARISVP
ncbi:GABA-specific permease [Leucoagaricus sp. SymC.cos]|nr:GABA-specific permease [Leucoagaricus sp. SymC.cos]